MKELSEYVRVVGGFIYKERNQNIISVKHILTHQSLSPVVQRKGSGKRTNRIKRLMQSSHSPAGF